MSRIVMWRNVNQFVDAPEVKHDGHAVTVVRRLTEAEADEEVGPMFEVRCLTDDETFNAFGEELSIAERIERPCPSADYGFDYTLPDGVELNCRPTVSA